ncbi:hypothetical protein [Streptomyces sp. NPDC047315]|uniref:hypothetical protein n=1 Tax=Streptomyces sp. NPDC047315 TaxID=3155142 RepID=UPI0033E69FE1
MSKSIVLSAANSKVGTDVRGVLTAPDGMPVLATPTTVICVGLFGAATATPATGALFGGVSAHGDAPLPEAVERAGSNVDDLTEAAQSLIAV